MADSLRFVFHSGGSLMMAAVSVLSWCVLLLLLAAASISDARWRRIPNGWVLTGLASGLALQLGLPGGAGLFDGARPGGVGVRDAGAAVLIMGLAGGLLWRLRLFGGGDAKLLGAVASFTGTAGVLPVLLLTLVAGGVLALAALVWPSLRLASGAQPSTRGRIPYSWAIAAGGLAYAATSFAGLLPR